MYVHVLSERWLIHASGDYSRPVATSVGTTLHYKAVKRQALFKALAP